MKKYIPFTSIIVLAILTRMLFIIYTNYTAEDAHITFQFARNIARGDGFALNPGFPIYGSTTPLLTMILAVWMLFSKNIILGARIVSILSLAAGTCFAWKAIGNKLLAFAILIPYVLSSKLITEEMQGMEMPLIFLFSMMAWYFWIEQKPIGIGIALGFLLWTRVDMIVFVGCLLFVMVFLNWRTAFQVTLWTAAIYLPWIVFSWAYFGSPIPFTIIAKQVAYGINNPPFNVHFTRIYNYLSPVLFFSTILGVYFSFTTKKYLPFSIFFFAEVIHLVVTGTTFFPRYFYLLTVSAFFLSGLAVYWILRQERRALVGVILFLAFLSLPNLQQEWRSIRQLQSSRHTTLIEVGKWLNRNTPQNSAVLLEPLGYVGYYADRIMYDEVGLVTPLAVELHKDGVGGSEFYKYFHPDYVIWTCGGGGESRIDIQAEYQYDVVFDGNSSRACYEIWELRDWQRAAELIDKYAR